MLVDCMRSMMKRRRLAVAAAALLLVQAGAQAEPANRSLVGAWRGGYVCAQGRSGLTLTITRHEGRAFSGYFHFYPPPGNPAAKEGCYTVTGRLGAKRGVTVTALDWVTRPPDYVAVDLAGRLGEGGRFIAGDVKAPWFLFGSCKTFEVDWQGAATDIAPACLRSSVQDGKGVSQVTLR